MSWAERAAERSPTVQRSRTRSMRQAKQIVDAANRLIGDSGEQFTTQELAKEAGIALQTFYRYFTGKDQLLLAVLEDSLVEGSALYTAGARDLTDPLLRLRFYVISALSSLGGDERDLASARFTTAQHWRLHQLFPDEMNRVTQPFTDLVCNDLREAQAAGMLAPSVEVEHAASFVTTLVAATFHHYAYAPSDEPIEVIAERLWSFCLTGLGGRRDAATTPVSVANGGASSSNGGAASA